MSDRATQICDECGSRYFADSSLMANLCPECALWLYGHPACAHIFLDGRCTKCHWDGAISKHLERLRNDKMP